MDPSYASKHTLPISTIVGVSDGEKGIEITTLERNVSVTSNVTDSQPFSQEELGSPTATRKPLSSPVLFADELMVQFLYTTVKENDSSSKLSSCLTLQEMARNENCLAKVAIAILCKDGHTEFGIREDEISEFASNASIMFESLYKETNRPLFDHWDSLLKSAN